MGHPKFAGKTGKDGKFYFNLTAKNGQVVLSSEGYASKSGAENGMQSVKTNSVNRGNYEVLTGGNGAPYFVLKAGNGEVIGRSEMYSTNAAVETGINSVTENAPVAEIEWAE